MNLEINSEDILKWVEILRSRMETAISSSQITSVESGQSTRISGRAETLTGPEGFPSPAGEDTIQQDLESLREKQPDFRLRVIESLGGQRDIVAVRVLERLVKVEPQWQLRVIVVNALGKMDIPEAIDTLMKIAQKDLHEEVRAQALHVLGARAIAVWPILAVRTRSVPRIRGAVRTRGATPSKSIGLSSEAECILRLLDQIRFRDSSPLVRRAADETLGRLDE